ncbi:MAG: FAD-dependent oxidoreductase, partial [Gammaproteobacteria bacterium]|nr:FAD-dependent oxidoreductase [Gammaproteobacteria bacterium]
VLMITNSFVDKVTIGDDHKLELSLKAFDSKTELEKVHCDYVITAIGQRGDEAVLKDSGINETDNLNRVKANKNSQIISTQALNNIFVAGDIKADQHMSLIGAIASGKKAAIGVRHLLEDYDYSYEGEAALVALNTAPTSKQVKEYQFTDLGKDLNQLKIKIKQFDLHQTCERCNHCIENFGCPSLIRIDGKITIEQSSCIRCGLCIDVCPNNAIGWQSEVEVA